MKDLNYSLIDHVLADIKIMKERTWLLKLIKSLLKKGRGTFDAVIRFEENVNYLNELGFNHEHIGTYHPILMGRSDVKNYKITVKLSE